MRLLSVAAERSTPKSDWRYPNLAVSGRTSRRQHDPVWCAMLARVAAEFGIWRIDGDKTEPVIASALANEAVLEAVIERDPSILGLDVLMVIGRQVITSFGTRIDLLAIDSEATLYIIEVKKARTPRDVVAQALDYGYWVAKLTLDQVASIYAEKHGGQSFDEGFRERFDDDPPEALAGDHRLVIVASILDPSTDRIVQYVRGQGVPIYVVFFQYFKEGETEFLARTWDADPGRSQEAAPRAVKKVRPPWNGQDFYISFGDPARRSWEDAVRYGFVSGGGNRWYSQTLRSLFPGARVFVCIPQTGYVGVGTVKETSQRIRDFVVEVDGIATPLLNAPLDNANIGGGSDDEDLSEYVVRVDWIKTLPKEQAIWKKGMFANQNTAARLRDPFTLETLIDAFALVEED